jgi:NTE family protein
VIDSLRRRGLWMRRAWVTDDDSAPGMAAVMVNTFNIAQDRIMRSRLAGDPPDFLLTLKTGRFGLFEFHRAAELIELGRASVRKAKDEILEHLDLATTGV